MQDKIIINDYIENDPLSVKNLDNNIKQSLQKGEIILWTD